MCTTRQFYLDLCASWEGTNFNYVEDEGEQCPVEVQAGIYVDRKVLYHNYASHAHTHAPVTRDRRRKENMTKGRAQDARLSASLQIFHVQLTFRKWKLNYTEQQ